MILKKGDIIKQIKTNPGELFKDTTANGELTYQVIRVNPKTYGLKCINGYMKGSGCNLIKSFKEQSTDIYGTVTRWELVKEA